MKESTFCNNLKKKLESEGMWVFKTHGQTMQKIGMPDLIVCCKYFLAIEVKVDSNTATKLQKYIMSKISNAKGISLIITCKNKLVYIDRLHDVYNIYNIHTFKYKYFIKDVSLYKDVLLPLV